MLSEWDLRLPHAWDHHELSKLLKCRAWEIKRALFELEDAGLLEEVGKWAKNPKKSIWRLKKGMYLDKGKRGEWLESEEEMEGRLSLSRRKGGFQARVPKEGAKEETLVKESENEGNVREEDGDGDDE